MKRQIYPCLWFDFNAREAAELYCLAFPDSVITHSSPVVVIFEIKGDRCMGLNGGPTSSPDSAISLFVICDSIAEVEHGWKVLSEGGQTLMDLRQYPWSERYGWLKDRFGVHWQLIFDPSASLPQKLIPALMFTGPKAGQAREAIETYTSILAPAEILDLHEYGPEDDDVAGMIKHSQFLLQGRVCIAMDSTLAHSFDFTEGLSLVLECDTQEEIDQYWSALTTGGEESMCGWLKDRYGVSWQIIPAELESMMSDPERSQRVMQSLLQMRKFDIDTLKKAYAGD